MNINIIIFIKDGVNYENASHYIRENIKSFANFQYFAYTNGSNVISLSADWERGRVGEYSTRISRIRDVKDFYVNLLHKQQLDLLKLNLSNLSINILYIY
jgi:aminoglycoside N3'-acetyltransferase